jgi:photosystem II stability/assembly factor-like uncharacterized protein
MGGKAAMMLVPARSVRMSLMAAMAVTVVTVLAVASVGLAAGPASDQAAATTAQEPVPEGFRVRATTWRTPASGWVLGETTCDGTPCAATIQTRDGGQRWWLTGTMDTPLAEPGGPGVTEVDFAGPRIGWAYGPSLFATSDGGRTWAEADLPGDGTQVLDLAANAGSVYAVVSPCEVGRPAECETPPALWHSLPALAALGVWRQVPVDLPVVTAATVAVEGPSAYVVAPEPPPFPGAFYATDNGRTWSARPTPCDNQAGEVLTDAAPQNRREVALLCVAQAGFSRAAKTAHRSDDNGRTTTPAGTAPLLGITSDLAAAPDGTLALASASSGSWIYLNDGGTPWTTPVAFADGGLGWNDLTMPGADVGYVVYDPAITRTETAGSLFATRDGGRTWTPVDLDA